MPGPWVKDWDKYEALRKKGKPKEQAARIANAAAAKGKRKGKGKKKPMRFGKKKMPMEQMMKEMPE